MMTNKYKKNPYSMAFLFTVPTFRLIHNNFTSMFFF